jgi:hypothetical protein
MLAVQKRGWMVVLPIIAIATVLSGFWLYRPYLGGGGTAAAFYGYGGALGVLALILGAGVVSPSLARSGKLAVAAQALADGAERHGAMATATRLRRRAMIFARIVSILIIAATMLMAMAVYV